MPPKGGRKAPQNPEGALQRFAGIRTHESLNGKSVGRYRAKRSLATGGPSATAHATLVSRPRLGGGADRECRRRELGAYAAPRTRSRTAPPALLEVCEYSALAEPGSPSWTRAFALGSTSGSTKSVFLTDSPATPPRWFRDFKRTWIPVESPGRFLRQCRLTFYRGLKVYILSAKLCLDRIARNRRLANNANAEKRD
jgi:hypothetical protein